jgi:hypothetical protein
MTKPKLAEICKTLPAEIQELQQISNKGKTASDPTLAEEEAESATIYKYFCKEALEHVLTQMLNPNQTATGVYEDQLVLMVETHVSLWGKAMMDPKLIYSHYSSHAGDMNPKQTEDRWKFLVAEGKKGIKEVINEMLRKKYAKNRPQSNREALHDKRIKDTKGETVRNHREFPNRDLVKKEEIQQQARASGRNAQSSLPTKLSTLTNKESACISNVGNHSLSAQAKKEIKRYDPSQIATSTDPNSAFTKNEYSNLHEPNQDMKDENDENERPILDQCNIPIKTEDDDIIRS